MLYVIEIGRKTRSESFMREAVRYIDSEATFLYIESYFKTQYKGFDVNVRVAEQDAIEHFVPPPETPKQSEPQKEDNRVYKIDSMPLCLRDEKFTELYDKTTKSLCAFRQLESDLKCKIIEYVNTLPQVYSFNLDKIDYKNNKVNITNIVLKSMVTLVDLVGFDVNNKKEE